jgi:hypothetical protein
MANKRRFQTPPGYYWKPVAKYRHAKTGELMIASKYGKKCFWLLLPIFKNPE